MISKSAGFPEMKCLEQILSFFKMVSVRPTLEMAAKNPSLRLLLRLYISSPLLLTTFGSLKNDTSLSLSQRLKQPRTSYYTQHHRAGCTPALTHSALARISRDT